MIQYSLKCDAEHRFDAWFQSAEAFDRLQSAGHVTCAVCGSTTVEKALMAPRIGHSGETQEASGPPSTPAHPAEEALRALKKHIEENATYVGRDFAREARAIHEGAAPERAIYGETRGDEARKLIEDGVPIAPLPFAPGRKTN